MLAAELVQDAAVNLELSLKLTRRFSPKPLLRALTGSLAPAIEVAAIFANSPAVRRSRFSKGAKSKGQLKRLAAGQVEGGLGCRGATHAKSPSESDRKIGALCALPSGSRVSRQGSTRVDANVMCLAPVSLRCRRVLVVLAVGDAQPAQPGAPLRASNRSWRCGDRR